MSEFGPEFTYTVEDVTAKELFGEDYGDRKGFLIQSPMGHGLAFDSYQADTDTGNITVETSTLDIRYVWSGGESEKVPGTGTKIVEAIIDEARVRNLKLGRALIHNARIISILEKLEREDQIADLTLLPHTKEVELAQTDELFERPDPITDIDSTKKWLESGAEEDSDGFSGHAVIGIFRIKDARH